MLLYYEGLLRTHTLTHIPMRDRIATEQENEITGTVSGVRLTTTREGDEFPEILPPPCWLTENNKRDSSSSFLGCL